MGFFSRLFPGFGRPSSPLFSKSQGNGIWVYLECEKCGEKIKLRLSKSTELQRIEESSPNAFYVRKLVMGEKCFTRIEVQLQFDQSYRIMPDLCEINNGTLLTEQEYEEN